MSRYPRKVTPATVEPLAAAARLVHAPEGAWTSATSGFEVGSGSSGRPGGKPLCPDFRERNFVASLAPAAELRSLRAPLTKLPKAFPEFLRHARLRPGAHFSRPPAVAKVKDRRGHDSRPAAPRQQNQHFLL